MEFTVKRSQWSRGNSKGETALLNSRGNLCCLGFFARQYGVSDENLIHEAAPNDCYDKIKPLIEIVPADEVEKYGSSFQRFIDGLFTTHAVECRFTGDCIGDGDFDCDDDGIGDCIFDNTLSVAAMDINDDITIGDAEREYRLEMLFDLFGHTVKFVD